MRKLPEGCPNVARFHPRTQELIHAEFYAENGYPLVEVMPLGTRALLDEALKMVERLSGPCTIQDRYEARTLLAKARGEGT